MEEKWVALIESILESAIGSFAVDNKNDQDLLRQLIDEVYRNTKNRQVRRPNICLMKFHHKTRRTGSRREAYTPGHPKILQKLEISDHTKGDFASSHEDTILMCYVSLENSSDDRAKQNMDVKNGQQVVANKKGIQEFASSMSGGERSFTICFLISCWQLMDMPFFILDEFDVFMDALNRKTSQEFLMKVAESEPHSQFFLFTPLAFDITTPGFLKTTETRNVKRTTDNNVASRTVDESPDS
ncbi:unnamed protein product [Allacma fusca]|uniref:Structural maintenance of chromosomes protein 6 n=1 Tax=Allacma fusca TaxID=39272 RepID=A0A8J2JC46_9HEXA|nr:unnamed protein product [Allacma fusca]